MEGLELWQQIGLFAAGSLAILISIGILVYKALKGDYEQDEDIEFKPGYKGVAKDGHDSTD